MILAERIRFLRISILKSKQTKPGGGIRNPKEILNLILTRTAIQDAYIQDRNLLSDFKAWQKENIESEKQYGTPHKSL